MEKGEILKDLSYKKKETSSKVFMGVPEIFIPHISFPLRKHDLFFRRIWLKCCILGHILSPSNSYLKCCLGDAW